MEKLIELGEWKPYGSKQKKAKMRKRKAEIEAKRKKEVLKSLIIHFSLLFFDESGKIENGVL